MTKRLQKEISRLQDQLEQERQNNQLLKVKQLEDKIFERERQFLHSKNSSFLSENDVNRRRTWSCSVSEKENTKPKSSIPQLMKTAAKPSKLQNNYLEPPPRFFRNSDERNSDDGTGSEKTLSPEHSEKSFQFKTPESFKGRISFDSPDVRDLLKENQAVRILHLEKENLDLKNYKTVEWICAERELKECQVRVKTLEENNLELQKNLIEKADLLEAAEER
jgi:hypothetical protein